MRFSLGQIYRKPGLDRAAFRDHYERRHTALARRILPPFSHYVRNHVVECTADAPDCLSEFGVDDETQLWDIAAILRDERGQPLLADELLFMDKSRNSPYQIERQELAPLLAAPGHHKYVVAMDGAVSTEALPRLAEGLHAATLCAARNGECAWLLGWCEQRVAPAWLQARLEYAGLAVRWCARVEEARGYPEFE